MSEIWSCKIGETDRPLPPGADGPMRDAIEWAYKKLTGEDAVFLFSGWGAELTEPERAAFEDRLPAAPTEPDVPALLADLDAAREALRRVEEQRDKLSATIKAYLGTDERAVHDAANLAHARDQRDALILAVKARDIAAREADQLRAAAEAERDRMQPVVEAARAYRDQYIFVMERPGRGHAVTSQSRALLAAVDTYETQENTE